MKIKCRILSVIGILVVAGVSACFLKIAWKNSTSQIEVPATEIIFTSQVRSFDLYIEDKLVLNSESVKLLPEDCTQTPEFVVAKYSSQSETTRIIGNHKFEATGKYLITARVWVNSKFCLKDYLLVTVVDKPTENTPVYVKPLNRQVYVNERTKVGELLDIKPDAEIEIDGTSGLLVDGDCIIGNKVGRQSVFVKAKYLDICVFYQLDIIVEERKTEQLILRFGDKQVDSLTFQHIEDEQMFTYEIVNSKMQIIACSVDGAVIKVVSCNSPTIVIKTLHEGECKLKITLAGNPSIVFEVKVVVID